MEIQSAFRRVPNEEKVNPAESEEAVGEQF